MTTAVRDQDVERFLYREARLLDQGRLEEWLELFSSDAVYWLPAGNGNIDPTEHVSIIYDTRREMNARVSRLRSGYAHAQDPASRMCRVISNVEIESGGDDGAVVVHCVMVLFALTHHGTEVHSARCEFSLRPDGDSWKIARKKVVLLRCDEALEGIPYLV
jgi:benzoate/toluate 1,2-dioxygenase subunit beta